VICLPKLDRIGLEFSTFAAWLRTEISMKRSKFNEAQIAFILQQAETGTPIGDVCRKAGIAAGRRLCPVFAGSPDNPRKLRR
jgi:putative transposase